MSAVGVFQTWWSLILLIKKQKLMGECFLACGEFKSKVYLIWYAQGFEGVDNLAP